MIPDIITPNIGINRLKDAAKDAGSKLTSKYISDIEFTVGKIYGEDVVLAVCGEGKVNAAVCAQTMALLYKPSIIINTGLAGALTKELRIGDIAIAASVVQHDFDLSPLGWAEFMVPMGKRSEDFPLGDKAVVNNIASGHVIEKIERSVKKCGFPYMTGVIATGDRFVANDEMKNWIVKNFHAIACEMEGGSVAQVCRINNIDFGIIRAISDNADENANNLNYGEIALRSIAVTLELVKEIAENSSGRYHI